jgi:hypothetical protein
MPTINIMASIDIKIVYPFEVFDIKSPEGVIIRRFDYALFGS